MSSKLFFLFVLLLATDILPGGRHCFAQQTLPSETFTVKEGLSENVVHALFQDRKGYIWIGTHEGLNRYDGYSFKKYMHNKNDRSSLPNSPVEIITEDENGNLNIIMSSERSLMDSSTGRFTTVSTNQKIFTAYFVEGLNFQLEPAWYIYSEKGSPEFKLSPAQENYLANKIFAASYYDRFKNLWLLDRSKLVLINEKGHEKIILRNIQLPEQKPLPNSIIADANRNLWIRLKDKIVCIDRLTTEIKTTIIQAQLPGLPLNNINALLLDRSNILWIGSFYGLRKLNLDYQHFRHIVYDDSKKGLANNFVLGLNIHAGTKLAVQHHYLDSLYSEIDLSFGNIQHHAIDKVPATKFLEQVLIKNADRVERAKLKVQLREMEDAKVNLRTLRFGYADHAGVIWTFGNPIQEVINFQDKRTVEINGSAEGILDDGTYLWIATTKAGLIRYHLATAERKDYRATTDPAALSSDNLLCFTADEKENLWIGTRGAGLNHFDKKKEIFTRYSEADGLSSNTIYCMVMDGPYLWMGTAKGLSCLDTRSTRFRNFYTADGLVNTEFNRWSAVKDNKGVLYFGGMNGIDYFRSEEILSSKPDPTAVHITAFKTGNEFQLLQPGVRLKPKQNFISFEFAAMDFRNPAATQYKYMLEGASNEWINAESNHTAAFASLGPGKYVFRVKAASQNGVWGREETLAFQILTPWWKQAWFSFVVVLLIVTALVGIYRFRIGQLRKVYQLRSKISQDLHDEMGATLTSISFLSEVASKQTASENESATQTINKIGEYSRDMIGEMNDIVWAINPANDKFEKIEDRMQNFAGPLLSARNIRFDLTTDSSMKSISLNMEQRKNLYLIFKEAVTNAAKYSGSDSVKVNMIRENNHIELNISDNGRGFDKNAIQPGNGLINMEQRAKEIKADITIHSQAGKGTQVILFMPLTQNT